MPPFIRFHLIRKEDVHGISGEGVVAEGVQFTDGRICFRWLHEIASTVVFDSMGDLLFVHGHGGKSFVQVLTQ